MQRNTFEQNLRVKELIESEKLRNPEGFRSAQIRNELPTFLRPAMTKAGITLAELDSYLEKEVVVDIFTCLDAFEERMSTTVDHFLFEPAFNHQSAPKINIGMANNMSKLQRYSRIRVPLRRIKLAALFASSHCLASSLKYGFKNCLLQSVFFSILSADLLRVSYNCFDKQYCALYLNMIGGSVSKVAGSLLKCVTTMVGLTELSEGPFIGFGTKIMWRNLINGTIMEGLYTEIAKLKTQ